MSKINEITIKIVEKWLRKGNMARCLRNVLPYTRLSLRERERIARAMHSIARWKRWYDFLIDYYELERSARTYVELATNKLKVDFEEAEKALPEEKRLAIRYSFSDYISGILEKNFPELIDYLNREPLTTLCVNLNKISREEAMDTLAEEGFKSKPLKLPTAILTEPIARYSSLIKEGKAHVQDEASQLVAKITSSLGRKILDYCAGTGGKTLAMASITRNVAKLYAYDIDKTKLDILKQRASLYKAKVKVIYKLGKTFDVVLVDAPCSGVGVARRNPEAKYIDKKTCEEFAEKQLSILEEASKRVKKDKYLVYSVCTFTPKETTEVVDKFIARFDFELYKIEHEGIKNGFTSLPEGDIFFIAIFKRAK
ncbi:MAG: RsmB/NOP family class I SAM-dependent RNA methyltransferase [Candidatus Hydrothermarchaeota archaeon]|nr:MAG: RsmB/NOP family class I SAM-dependent RNA methyltransferase [Candidatus Hydrothermarchaeota archaeon]